MGLRRIAACDQRRRRVLIEEHLNVVGGEGEPDAQRQPPPSVGRLKGQSYSDAAALSAQTSSIAVLASRPLTLVLISLACLVAVVGLLTLYSHWQLWPLGTWQRSLSCLDVQRPGSLATWICSLMLSAAAFQGIQIYRLRRHKKDDYRGRYRVWAWFPMLLLAMASGVATGVQRELTTLLVRTIWGDDALELASRLPLALVFLWLPVAVRLSLEMRPTRWSLGFLAAATIGYASGVIVAQIPVQPFNGMLVDLISSTLLMAGHLGVFVAVLSFGRHVYLDSQGLLPAQDTKPRRAKRRNRGSAAGKSRRSQETADQGAQEQPAEQLPEEPEDDRVVPPSEIALPVLRLGSRADDAVEDSPDDDATDASPGERLSKTERKRLKKMRRQEQLRRAA